MSQRSCHSWARHGASAGPKRMGWPESSTKSTAAAEKELCEGADIFPSPNSRPTDQNHHGPGFSVRRDEDFTGDLMFIELEFEGVAAWWSSDRRPIDRRG
ncbi:MAG: hypothetical protein AAFX94_20645, partial [Myxococcota bacterium]